ncbi:unnamed protein product [Aphanomyces euteiches]|nr:hypothetical protein AeRB84_007037 [Aphanomyces euteiches]
MFRNCKKEFSTSTPLTHKVSGWYKTIATGSKCTCPKHKPVKAPKKPKMMYHEPIKMPRKYDDEKKLYSYVGGERVPYIPAQNAQLREARRSFDPIEETTPRCAYCQSKHHSSDNDDEDY